MDKLIKGSSQNNILIGLFFLYAISIFTSKFGISFFGGSLALISIFYFKDIRKNFIKENMEDKKNLLYIFFSTFVMGIVLQFFSLGGIKSSGVFFYRTYFLLIFPFTIFFLNKFNFLGSLFKIMKLTLFVAILKSFQIFYSVHNLKYTSAIRVTSFFDIMRWGIVLVIGLLIILPSLNNKFTKENLFSWIIFLSGVISLILNNSRGPFISFVLGVTFYIIMSKKLKTGLALMLIILTLSGGILLYKPAIFHSFSTRIESIKDTKSSSNGSRLFMWKESLNFMNEASKNNKRLFLFGTGLDGTGMKRRRTIFKKYLNSRETFKNLPKNIRDVSFMDAHNCYLNRYIETGIIFSLIYYLALIFTIYKVFKNYIYTKNNFTLGILSVSLAYAFCGIFYGYPAPYETFTFMFILSLGLVNNPYL